MQEFIKDYLNELTKRKKRHKKVVITVALLVVLVIGTVGGVLGRYGVAMTGRLDCGMEEHEHGADCYEKVLVCEEDASHEHGEECYEEKLICEKEEHKHDDSCYANAQEEPKNIEEEPEQWEEQYAGVEWKDAWGEDLVTAAKKQLGYEGTFVVLEDGSEKTYTRYGHFANDKYLENWDSAFVNFCMHFAGLEDAGIFEDETDTAKWISEFEKKRVENKDFLTSEEDYTPKAGDLVFLQEDGEEQRMGIVSSYNNATGEIKVIQGDSKGKVEENTYDETDSTIKTYVKISELEASCKNLPGTEGNGLTDENEPAEGDGLTDGSEAAEGNGLTDENELTGKNELTEERAQVERAIALIEELPAQEEVQEKFAELEELEDEEAYERAYEAYYQELAAQVAKAREAYEGLSGEQQAAVTNAEKLRQYEWLETETLEDAGSEAAVSEGLKISLLYGDQEDHPDGYSYYTHDTMSGFIKLEPSNLTENLENVVVTLTIPKEYVEAGTVKISKFTTDSNVTKYTIPAVTEDAINYYASIDFSAYDKTQTLRLPFALSFKDDVVPDNYELPVTAKITYAQDSNKGSTVSNKITYKPQYKDWGITKFVNSNRLDDFAKDNAEAVVTSPTAQNPYLDEKEYVEFYFRVNRVINPGSDLDNYRDVSSVTLTDTLPSYETKDGGIAIAKFDPEANKGWILNGDGKTVSKTYNGKDSHDVLLQIYNDEPLKLQFPGLEFTEDSKNNKNLIAKLKNTVELLAIPSNEQEGETRPSASDPLPFVITTDPSTDGRFTKVALGGTVYDINSYKTNPYPWRIRVSNNGVQPLEHIQIQDREIAKGEGEDGLGGLDDRLKFVKLESDWKVSVPATSGTITDAVEKVVAYYTDDTRDEFYIKKNGEAQVSPASGSTIYVQDPDSMVDSLSNFTVEFDKDKVCDGYDIIFKDDFKLQLNEAVSFKAYTVYRDPEHTVVPNGVEKLTFTNSARSVNIYKDRENTPVYVFLTVENTYDMLPTTEKLWIEKSTRENSATQNNHVGDKYFYDIYLRGSLMTPDQKEYGDIQIVDLLPNEVEYVKTTNGYDQYTNSEGQPVRDGVKPDIIENYHNSGRTALIFHITYDMLTNYWKKTAYGTLSIQVQIREDAKSGSVLNYAYVVGDNLEPYTLESGGTLDIYDLNNNGRTDDRIAYDDSSAVITAAESIYAEKFIALKDSNNWSKQGLFLKAGMDFDYLLKVTNETKEKHTGLVVYDTLPTIGDKGIFDNSDARNSEFQVQLREAITPPTGCAVYYTDSKDVYASSMSNMVSEGGIWYSSEDTETWTEENWSQVTAFKLVANEGVELTNEAPFQVRIPVCVPSTISDDSKDLLKKKEYQDQNSGTMAYLQATNNFGFMTKQAAEPKESNAVWARIPFAGFDIKKVDSISKVGIEGATFELTKVDDENFKQTVTSAVDGSLKFRDLTEGTYTLTETKFPTGYSANPVTGSVIITQNAATMEYEVKFSGFSTGEPSEEAGTSSDPLIIENVPLYELPSAGGIGTLWYQIGGTLLMCLAGMLILSEKKYARRHQKG